jgi:hypothetical protein
LHQRLNRRGKSAAKPWLADHWDESLQDSLAKGAKLCHGTGGNGYAFLKLYRRTKNAVWLDHARAFAMTGIAQYREARE